MMMKDNVIEDIASIVFRNFQKENPAIQLLKQKTQRNGNRTEQSTQSNRRRNYYFNNETENARIGADER